MKKPITIGWSAFLMETAHARKLESLTMSLG